ncbi:MAG: regulator [Magnetococcales bacterium]|nr:regulator [Magnetococcales bacterium]MBF0438816.1 regulator [Magnetococcales bacterium]
MIAAVVIIGACGLAAGGYLLGVNTAGKTAKTATEAQIPTPQTGAPLNPQNAQSVGRLPPGSVAPPSHANIIKENPDGSIQAAPPTNPGAKFTHFQVGNRNVKDMLLDGNFIYVGTSGGVIRYDIKTNDYKLFDVRNGSLLANGVFHVGRLSGDRISVGTYGGGWSILDLKTEKWTTYNIPNGLADPFIYDVLELPNGDIWLATWSGANRIRGGALDDRTKWDTFTVENTKGGLPNDWVYGLAAGKNGEIWIATEGGLARFKDDQWTHWTHESGLGAPYDQVKDVNQYMNDPAKTSSHHAKQKEEQGLSKVTTAYNPNYIISLEVDKDGIVWCGTWGGGLARFDGEKWTNITTAEGLPSNFIFMLRLDEKGTVWIGTSKGLARREGDGYKVLTMADGLFAENVFSFASEGNGTIWVGSFGGVARIFPPGS